MNTPLALLSVFDKSGIEDLGRGLADLGWELLASGGTARALRQAGLQVHEVSDWTGFPEILEGRVKTLHTTIHAGLLSRGTPADQAELDGLGIRPIDLAVCNLYPFARTVARPDVSLDEAVKQIDIGGVAILRAAAKNFERVTALVDPADYALVLDELRQRGEVAAGTRRRLAYKAFAHTAAYDEAIRAFLEEQGFAGPESPFPERLTLHLQRAEALRYGENPHQQAALYHLPGANGFLGGQLLQGKALSYNNLLDLDAAWRVVQEYEQPALAIIKHGNPCGLANAAALSAAFAPALAGDPVSAFGGVIGANRPFDGATAQQLGDLFVEAIVAPAFTAEARQALAGRTSLRLLEINGCEAARRPWEMRSVQGGVLLQGADSVCENGEDWQVVTQRAPDEGEWTALRFGWKAAGHVKSNAIVFVRSGATGPVLVGVGAGQMSRVDSVHIAAMKAGERARGAVMASDAFFPFPDGIETAAAAGVTAVIQPGGSMRDADAIAAADRLGLAMVFTGRRHFRH
jgi:phosphoribosylaminoimidazolecarboxamide formyltransferase/IMP cyclohydrolase